MDGIGGRQSENPNVIVNNSITMDCTASAIPVPMMRWYKDGLPLDDSADERVKVINNGFSLEITNAQVEDTGRYSCIASNEAGETDKNFDLDVFGEFGILIFVPFSAILRLRHD